MHEASNYIYKILNEKISLLKEKGILILPFPPGIGKTYNVVQFIKENYKTTKMFFISNQLKLLPPLEKIIENCSPKEKKEITAQYLEIPSLLDGFRECLYDNPFYEFEEFKEIQEIISSYDSSDNQEIKSFFSDKFRDLEQNFRKKLKNKIKDKEYLEKYRKYIEHLYPATLLYDKNIIMLTTKKFFYPIDTIFHSTIYLPEEKFENSIVFIDEIDSTKAELLDLISSSNMRYFNTDCIGLFRRIYDCILDINITNSLLFNNVKEYADITDQYFKKGTNILKRLYEYQETYKDLYYQVKDPFKRVEDKDETKNFIFKDKYSIVIQNETNSYKNDLYVYHSQDKLTNQIAKEAKSTSNDKVRLRYIVDNVIYAIKGFMFEILSLAKLYNEYQNKYGLKNTLDIREKVSLKQSLNSILDRLSLGEENRAFLLETIYNISNTIELDSSVFEIEGKRDRRKRKYDFYYDGFSFIQLRDYEDRDLQTKTYFNMYNITPEGMMLKLVNNYPVVGLSATANFDSCLKNYDLNFLKYKLNEKFIELSHKEIEEFNEIYFNSLEKYDVLAESIPDKETLRCIIKQYFDNFEEFEDELNIDFPSEKVNDIYNIIYEYKMFIDRDAHSFIFFLNYNLNNYEKMLNFLNKWISKLDDQCELIVVDKTNFAKTDLALEDKMLQNKKIFLISCYQTIGTGVNLQYKLPDEKHIDSNNLVFLGENKEKKDIDGCFLSMPTNILPFYEEHKDIPKETMLKLLYSMEYLKANDQLNISTFNKAITNIFYNKRLSNAIGRYISFKDVNVGVLMVLIQAIGRICRTNIKNKVVYIGYDPKVAESVGKVKKTQKNNLFNYECQQFLNSIKDTEQDSNLKQRLTIANIETFKNIRDSLNWPWDYTKMIFWKKLREFVLMHPTASEKDFAGNREFQKYYLKFSKPISCYSVDKYNFTTKVDLLVSENSNGLLEKRYYVSDRDCQLYTIMKNEYFSNYFQRHAYATCFNENEYVMSPYLYHSVYKGALGEAIGKACFSKYGLELKEINDVNTFELFDYQASNKYLDFKKWSSCAEIKEDEQLKKIVNKMKACKTDEAFIINVIRDYYDDSTPEGIHYATNELNLFTISWLYDLNKNKFNEIAIYSIIGKVKASEAVINKRTEN